MQGIYHDISFPSEKFSDGVTNFGYAARNGRPLLCDENTKCRIHNVVIKAWKTDVYYKRSFVSLWFKQILRFYNYHKGLFCTSRVCAKMIPRLLLDDHKKAYTNKLSIFPKRQSWGRKVAFREFFEWKRLACINFISKSKELKYEETHWFSNTKESKGFKKPAKTDVHIFADRHGMILTHSEHTGQPVNVSYYSRVNILYAIFKYLYNNIYICQCLFLWKHYESKFVMYTPIISLVTQMT